MSRQSRRETLEAELEARIEGARRREQMPTEDEILRDMQASGIDLDTIEVVRFGIEMQAFVQKSAAGRYLVNSAEAQLGDAMRQLLDLDSLDDTKARELHLKAKVAVNVLKLIENAVVAGQEAEAAIRAHEQADDVPELAEGTQ